MDVLKTSWDLSSPIDTDTISFARPCSLSFTASSMAFSSGGLTDILTFWVSTPLLSLFTLI